LPLGREVDFLFRTGDDPPDPAAVGFFQRVEEEYPRLWSKVGEAIFEGLPVWEDGTTMPELFNSLHVTHICLWNLRTSPKEWELYCITEKFDGALIRVYMQDFEYFDFGMDT
jgi:hypothetical protein